MNESKNSRYLKNFGNFHLINKYKLISKGQVNKSMLKKSIYIRSDPNWLPVDQIVIDNAENSK